MTTSIFAHTAGNARLTNLRKQAHIWLLIGTGFLVLTNQAFGSTNFLDFEDLPDAYFFSAGGQNIGSIYSGLTFGPYTTGLSASRFGGYDDTGFPPHSGDVVVWSAFDDPMTISFSADETSVGFWYVSLNPIMVTAYGGGGDMLGVVSGLANTDGTTGVPNYIEFDGAAIASIAISGGAGQYVIDDLTFTGGLAIPEPSPFSCFGVSVGLFALLLRRRRQIRYGPKKRRSSPFSS